MKRNLFFLAMLFIATIISAQDVIITMDSRKIEAKILEVSETEIRYKEKDNPNGPTFVISADKISTIMYSNGTIKVFNDGSKQPQSGNQSSQYNVSQGSVQSTNFQRINKVDKLYYMGNQSMTESEYLYFIQNNCQEAWQSYQSGKNLWKNGWILFGSGMGAIVLGTSLIAVPGSLYYSPILWGAGGGLVIGSIPCLIIGGKRKNNSHEIYNEMCARRNYSSSLELGIQLSQNGVGLGLKF